MANAQASGATPTPGIFTTSKSLKTVYSVCMFVGLLLFGLGLMKDSNRMWHSYLTSYFYFVSLALGGLFFTTIQHVANAGWSATIRRFSESMTAFLPVAAVATIVLLFGMKQIYTWMDPQLVAQDSILRGKASYLNVGFFVVRLVVFFGLWLIFAKKIVGNSVAQDKDRSESHTLRNVALSIAFLLIFAISYSLFSVDTMMSLQPHWYSTMWGVYCFAGLFQSSLAFLTILTIYMMRKGLVNGLVTTEHLHDLGKFLKAFTVFYAYIGFSQFLLIWYANLPEETIFYLARSGGGWMTASFSLLIFKFAVPFLLLLPRAAKRNSSHLVLVSILILFMQYIDVHWMVYPTFSSTWLFSWYEIGAFMLLGGAFLWSVSNFLSKNSVVAVGDPRIQEAIHHHVTY